MDGAVKVIALSFHGKGGQVGQVFGILGSSSQHNVLSENKRVYGLRVLFIKYKRKCEIHACDRPMGRSGWLAYNKCS